MLMKQGMIGVGSLHQQLIEAGETIDAAETDAGFFGDSTLLAVRHFQARHVDEKGRALAEDGMVGPGTIWALIHPGGGETRKTASGWRCEPSEARPAVRRVLEVAVGEIGVHEQPDGSNRGARVDVYTAPDFGIFWCAAFASWCYLRGAEDGSPFGRFTASWQFYEWGAKNGRLLTECDEPQAGDVGVILRGDPAKRPRGHTTLFAGLTDDRRSICTVEGNSGNAVRGLVRPRPSFTAIIRPISLT